MFHYRGFGCLGALFVDTQSFRRLHRVSRGCTAGSRPRRSFRRFQSVNKLLHIAKKRETQILMSRNASAITLYIEGPKMPGTCGDAQPKRRTRQARLIELRSLPSTLPGTHTGQVLWAWPEIEAALASGWRPKEVWEAARLDGIEIPYPQFRVYVSRIRRRGVRVPPTPAPVATTDQREVASPSSSDPFRNLREMREKKRLWTFEYDPFPNEKNLF